MATYERRERVTRIVEFVLPARAPYGACWSDVDRAIDAAVDEWRRDRGLEEHDLPADDQVWVTASDDQLIVGFVQQEVES